ncbi:MAG: TRAP transporter large permease subunit [Candidatus Competibacteraceae bacterium]|nr:TRAP transporter large permease subunit [Candidatus Competibacteraceae bacterium]
MDIGTITLLMLGTLLLLLVIGMPMAFALGFVGVAFTFGFYGWDALMIISSRIYGFVNVYVLVAVPMFLMMASIMDKSGVARDLYTAMSVWAGGLRGGVAIMTLVAAVFMAATTGIIGGEIILLGLVALPQMLRLGYNKNLAIGTICAGGSLGTMIPPSIVLIFYGLTTNVSIGDLFLAVIIPGLILAGLYFVYILTRCYLNPELGPPLPLEERDIPLREKFKLLGSLVLPMGVALGVLGSIYAGIAAVSEAAAVGVAGTILAAWIRGELSWQMLRESLQQTMAACGLLLWLTFGATALIGVYNLLGGIRFISDLMTGLPFDPLVVVVLMMLMLIVLGLFMDWVGVLLLTMPIFVPIIKSLGYDPIWFGILFCMNMQISYLSPPFGPAAFYLKGVAPPEISLQDIYRALWPFMLLQIVGMSLVLFFPQLALWLPGLG